MAESEYKQALVTHIDILGFREMVKESEREPSRISDLRYVLKVLKKQIGTGMRYSSRIPDGYHPPTPLFRAFNFSDLTVRATIIEPEDDFLDIFMDELFTLVNEQCRLACRDDGNSPILLRGGVTLGPIDVHPGLPEEDFLFGPAVVRAYDLESTAAIFPRIVIDPKVVKKAASMDSTDVRSQILKSTGMFYKQLVSMSEDGVYFVDYLNACEDYSYSNFFVFGGGGMSFATHKHMIETRLKILKEEGAPERTIQKYLWLANYHNSKVPSLPDPELVPPVFEGEPDDAEIEQRNKLNREALLISEELLNLLK